MTYYVNTDLYSKDELETFENFGITCNGKIHSDLVERCTKVDGVKCVITVHGVIVRVK